MKSSINTQTNVSTMKRISFSTTLLILLFPFLALAAEVEVFFSPDGKCTEQIVSAIDHAERSIFVAAYQLSDETIAKALLNATRRNVAVAIIADRTQKSPAYSKVPMLAEAGLPVFIDTSHRIFHHKFMIIDSRLVITGSFNFTFSASTRNAENLVLIRDEEIAKLFLANWIRCQTNAMPFLRKEPNATGRLRRR
jgi:phosphatidylserine/phosphatidylglycerophosphate/cardiolipin synthase-like enzyme